MPLARPRPIQVDASPSGAHAAAPSPAPPRSGFLDPDPALAPIREKVLAGRRLSLAEGATLFSTPDIWSVCEMADLIRRRLSGDIAYYNINRHLNYSNICALSCKFCEFYRKAGDEGAYERSLEEIRKQAAGARDNGATEMHIVGGLHPTLPFDYYVQMMRVIREEAPRLHIKAFTAVEIVHLAKIAKVFKQADRKSGIRWVLERLKEAGLGSLPGGGAEVFDDRVHDEAFKGKIRSDVWLDVHKVAHELGLNTNATILYGHIEQREDRLVHMDMLRRAQDIALARLGYTGEGTQARRHEGTKQNSEEGGTPDEAPVITLTRPGTPLPSPTHPLTPSPSHAPSRAASPQASKPFSSGSTPASTASPASASPSGYFQTIIPLPFFPDGSDLEHLPGPAGLENLRTLAVARLMLDNFPHVKAFWIMQTLPMAQIQLQSGADDIDGTVVWYDITKVGGAGTHQEVTVSDLRKAIRDAGFKPVERDTLYRRVERDEKNGADWRVIED